MEKYCYVRKYDHVRAGAVDNVRGTGGGDGATFGRFLPGGRRGNQLLPASRKANRGR